MTHVLISRTWGGLHFGKVAMERLADDAWPRDAFGEPESGLAYLPRSFRADERVLAVVRDLGVGAFDRNRDKCYEIVEVPDGVVWTIENYDGSEWIAERHRTWPGGRWNDEEDGQ